MKKDYSKIYRIMHWSLALSFIFLLLTIFLRLTWMNKVNMADIIEKFLSEKDVSLTKDELIVLAKKIRAPMWQWHIYIGYILVGLISLRFLLPAFGEMKIQNPLNKQLTIKEKFQRWTYILFYIGVIISLITGLIIELGPKEYKKSMEAIHVLSLYYLIPYLVFHLAGVMIDEFTNHKGIISKIISGKR